MSIANLYTDATKTWQDLIVDSIQGDLIEPRAHVLNNEYHELTFTMSNIAGSAGPSTPWDNTAFINEGDEQYLGTVNQIGTIDANITFNEEGLYNIYAIFEFSSGMNSSSRIYCSFIDVQVSEASTPRSVATGNEEGVIADFVLNGTFRPTLGNQYKIRCIRADLIDPVSVNQGVLVITRVL